MGTGEPWGKQSEVECWGFVSWVLNNIWIEF